MRQALPTIILSSGAPPGGVPTACLSFPGQMVERHKWYIRTMVYRMEYMVFTLPEVLTYTFPETEGTYIV